MHDGNYKVTARRTDKKTAVYGVTEKMAEDNASYTNHVE